MKSKTKTKRANSPSRVNVQKSKSKERELVLLPHRHQIDQEERRSSESREGQGVAVPQDHLTLIDLNEERKTERKPSLPITKKNARGVHHHPALVAVTNLDVVIKRRKSHGMHLSTEILQKSKEHHVALLTLHPTHIQAQALL